MALCHCVSVSRYPASQAGSPKSLSVTVSVCYGGSEWQSGRDVAEIGAKLTVTMAHSRIARSVETIHSEVQS